MADDEQDEDDDEDDEQDDEDDYVNIKLEPEDGLGLTKPITFSAAATTAAATPRKAAGAAVHRSVASSTDGSDSEGARAVLSSGLPGSCAAPSPPAEQYGGAEWSMHLHLDELDLDLGGADVLGPESVGLEELDLAWGSQVKTPVKAGLKVRA